MTVVSYDPNILALDGIMRTAKGFNNRSIADAACDPQTRLMKDNIDAVRIAGIHNRGLRVAYSTYKFGNQSQLKR